MDRIWLIDLQSQLPTSAVLDGFDVSASQFPPKEWLPHNVSLYSLDIFEDIPERWCGQYDIINIRYFCCVVRDNAPDQIIRNILKMLSMSYDALVSLTTSQLLVEISITESKLIVAN